MNTVCRICLESSSSLIDIRTCWYEGSCESRSYYEIFVTIVDLVLDTTDSHLICPKCKNLLSLAYELRLKAKKSADYLRNQAFLFVEAKCEAVIDIKKEDIELGSCQDVKGEVLDVKEAVVSDDDEDKDWLPEVPIRRPKPLTKSQRSHWEYRCRFCHELKNTIKEKRLCERIHIQANKGYECHHCSYRTTRRSTLVWHLDTHLSKENRPIFICQTCGRELRTRNNLREHMDRFHRIDQENVRKIICDICDKRFVLHGEIKKHIEAVHLKIRKYSCSKCSITYKRSHNLRDHMKNEHKDSFVSQEYICPICGKILKTSNSLNSHQITHTGEYKYKCDVPGCLSIFRHSNSLRSHRLVHEPVQFLQCEYCPKRFRHANSLKTHSRMHTDEMHKCQFCEKSYVLRFLLKEHVAVAHHGKRYSCTACGCGMTSKNNLKRHIQLHCTEGVKKRH